MLPAMLAAVPAAFFHMGSLALAALARSSVPDLRKNEKSARCTMEIGKESSQSNSLLLRSCWIWSLASFCMYGVSPNVKYGGMRLCQTSGAGRVSWNRLVWLSSATVGRLVGEMILPRTFWCT